MEKKEKEFGKVKKRGVIIDILKPRPVLVDTTTVIEDMNITMNVEHVSSMSPPIHFSPFIKPLPTSSSSRESKLIQLPICVSRIFGFFHSCFKIYQVR